LRHSWPRNGFVPLARWAMAEKASNVADKASRPYRGGFLDDPIYPFKPQGLEGKSGDVWRRLKG
jgi:hypothetical protein